MEKEVQSNTIYIAGPMRGYENWNYAAFDSKANHLREQGWNVINPAELDRDVKKKSGLKISSPESFNPSGIQQDQDYLRLALERDLTTICRNCDSIYMLSGWEDSYGAKAEWALAKALGLNIYYEIPLPND